MADIFHNGKKIGYSKPDGTVVMFDNNTKKSNSSDKKYESKNHAELQIVTPQEGQKFDSFQKIFAWKKTKRFGLISLEAFKNKEQKTLEGQPVEKGFEKWYARVKTGISTETISCIYNTKKKILSFKLGNTQCAISPTKNYFVFIMPEVVKNAKLRK